LVEKFPAVPDYQDYLANSHTKLGFLLMQNLEKRSEAEEQYRKALVIHEKLAAEFPTAPQYQIGLGLAYFNLGQFLALSGQSGESLNWFEKAIRPLSIVYEKDGQMAMARMLLYISYSRRATTYYQMKKYDEACGEMDRWIEQMEQPGLRAQRAIYRVMAGRITEAVVEVEELTKSSNGNASQFYNFACVFSLASSKTADKKQEYGDRAMELLQQAVKAGMKDAAHIAKDTDLDPLRDREDFKKLLAELETKSIPEKEKK
jgi:tetratricopeptide (TPR) repeat protein